MSFSRSIPKIPPNASSMLSSKTHYHIFIFSYDVEWNSVVCFEEKIMLQNLYPSRGNHSFLSFYLSISLFNTIKRWKNIIIGSTRFLFPSPPMNCGLPGFSDHGILQARILEWIAIPFSRGIFLTQGSNAGLPHCRQILYHLRYWAFIHEFIGYLHIVLC